MPMKRRRHRRRVPWKVYEDRYLVTEADAASFLDLPLAKLRAMRRRFEGPAHTKFGRFVRYAMVDLIEFMQARGRPPADRP